MHHAQWRRRDGGFVLDIEANRFLHHMVRNLVGTMLDVGRGYTDAGCIPDILAARSRALLIGDFLSEPEAIARTVAVLASSGAAGQVVLIVDPLEETFPFEGHVELLDSDSPARLRLGEARGLREDYLARFAAHRAAIVEAARPHGWAVTVHRTDQSATAALLSLATALGSLRGGVG